MNKQNAINAIKFLNEVKIKGHVQREAMNAICEDLLAIVNFEEKIAPEDNNGETNTE